MSSNGNQESSPEIPKTYKECLKNHWGTCMEFFTTAEKSSLETVWCICGCHVRDHRMVEPPPRPSNASSSSVADVASTVRPPQSPPTQPQTIANYHDAADSVSGVVEEAEVEGNIGGERQKRPKTKFTAFQKEKLREYAEKVGWTVQKKDKEDRIRFCEEIGITPKSCKNWITNNRKLLNKARKNKSTKF